MTSSRQIVLDNKLEFIRETSDWYKKNGYCENQFKWVFKIFHIESSALFDICSQLISNGFIYSSIKWNRSFDYDVRGWALTIFTVRAFDEKELTDFRLKLEMWLIDGHKGDFSFYSYLDDATKEKNSVTEPFRADVMEFEPMKVLKRQPTNDNWEKRWDNSLNKELELLNKPEKTIPTTKLDRAIKDIQSEVDKNECLWVEFLPFELKGRSIYLTDLRPGPCEDGVKIKLEKGNYDVQVCLKVIGDIPVIAAMRVTLEGIEGTDIKQVDEISIDGGSLGFYDYERIRSCFGYDMEALYSWGESKMLSGDDEYGVLVYDLKRGYILPFVQSGYGDGVYPVYEVLDKGFRVGALVEFIKF